MAECVRGIKVVQELVQYRHLWRRAGAGGRENLEAAGRIPGGVDGGGRGGRGEVRLVRREERGADGGGRAGARGKSRGEI